MRDVQFIRLDSSLISLRAIISFDMCNTDEPDAVLTLVNNKTLRLHGDEAQAVLEQLETFCEGVIGV